MGRTRPLMSRDTIEGGGGVSDAERASYAANGFVTLETIAPAGEIAVIRATLERLMAEGTGYDEGALFDMVAADGEPGNLPQLINPSVFAPALRATRHRANAARIARQLLGPEARLAYEYAIMKPAHHGAETPWHQDEAFKTGAGEDYAELSIWMPLQAATVENGCMRYIPGSHLGPVLAHRSPADDPRVHAVECIAPFDKASAVACPVPAGGCVIHDKRTIHGAGANGTAAPRLAYVLMFDTPVRGPARDSFTWLAEKRSPALERRRAWRRRGGWIREVWRKATSGGLDNLPRVQALVARVIRNWRRL